MNDGLVCSKLTKRYGKGAPALDGIDLSIPSHGIFSIIGRNGAGKTTLTRILATELMPSSGTATINGIDIVQNPNEVRDQIAILPQEARAVQWLTPRQTIFSYLLYRGLSRREADSRVAGALAKLGIKKYENSFNRFLSGGLKRKVLMATVLAAESKVIFVDEPTTGLDPISRSELWVTLNELKKDHFIFLTTHYLEEAEKLADMIGVLENGRLLGLGTLDNLRKKLDYQYSIRILNGVTVPKTKVGKTVKGADGSIQILTTEDETDKLAGKLIQDRVKFSINPISLEDIFYYLVKKPIEEDAYRD